MIPHGDSYTFALISMKKKHQEVKYDDENTVVTFFFLNVFLDLHRQP
jgi:hypothetical protein